MRKFLLLGWVFLTLLLKIDAAEQVEKVVIIGSGPAGLSAAIFTGRESLSPLVIDKEKVGSLIFEREYLIENYPGFAQGIESTVLYDNMRRQATEFGARFMNGLAISVDLSKRPFRITVDKDRQVFCETLIIATGQVPLKISGQEEMKGKGVTGFENAAKSDYVNKDVIILGAGDTALSAALRIAPDAKKVTIVHLEDRPAAAKYLLKRAEGNPNIHFISNTTIKEFHDGSNGKLKSVELFNSVTKQKTSMPAGEVIIAIGLTPNSNLFKGKLKMNAEGYILTDPHSTMTSTPGVFVAGDVSDSKYRKIITSVGMGARAGMGVGGFLYSSGVR